MPTLLNGADIPFILYGTARREQKEAPDVPGALQRGYRALDTSSSRRFHNEAIDGQSIMEFLTNSGNSTSREEILIQSKYAPPSGQAEPWPYEITDDIVGRVFKSVLRSASDLGVEVIDVYFLSTPLKSLEETLEAWCALEHIVARGGIRYLGIANVKTTRLRELCSQAQSKPKFVQNWFQKATGYDQEVVRFCRENDIVYQAFGIFDEANAFLLDCDLVRKRAVDKSITSHQALLQLLLAGAAAKGLQLCILDGTANRDHMNENLCAVSQLDGLRKPDIESFLGLIGWS